MPDPEVLFDAAQAFIRSLFAGESTGHDAEHSLRVFRTAMTLQEKEGGDRLIIGLAALLHDADDPKLFSTAPTLANARGFLESQGVTESATAQILSAISTVSFKGGHGAPPATLEGQLVQDADRLDAIGAIGIARAFAYGGAKGRPLYLPDEPPRLHMTEQEYRANHGATINHFYEKLLLLENLMNTPAAKALAHARHTFMLQYLDEFFAEWDGRR